MANQALQASGSIPWLAVTALAHAPMCILACDQLSAGQRACHAFSMQNFRSFTFCVPDLGRNVPELKQVAVLWSVQPPAHKVATWQVPTGRHFCEDPA
jgi:hypothetical protein